MNVYYIGKKNFWDTISAAYKKRLVLVDPVRAFQTNAEIAAHNAGIALIVMHSGKMEEDLKALNLSAVTLFDGTYRLGVRNIPGDAAGIEKYLKAYFHIH